MVDTREVARLYEDRQAEKKDEQHIIRSELTTVGGSVEVSGRPGYVWHLPHGASYPAQVFNRAVQIRDTTPVLIGKREGSPLLEVLGLDTGSILNWEDYTTPLVANHARDHEPAGGDVMFLYPEAFLPLMVYPTGALVVRVRGGEYSILGIRKTFVEVAATDLASAKPTAGKRYVGFYIDSSNALQTVNGTVVSLVSATIPEPTFPAETFQVALVEMRSDTTALEFGLHVVNKKLIYTDGSGGASYPFTVITVDPTDSDADYSTITAAIAAASGGEAIVCGPATYNEDITINKAVTVIGLFGPERTKITDSGVLTVAMTADNGKIIGFEVENTGTGALHYNITFWSGDNCIVEDCVLTDTGAATERRGIAHIGGTGCEVRNVRTTIDAATASYGYHGGLFALDVKIINSFLSGATADLYNTNVNCTVELINTQLLNDTLVFDGGTLRGSAIDSQGRDAGVVIENTSGAVANAYDLGFLDAAGEYQTTTTAQDNVPWHVVSIGGSANNGFVFAKNREQATVNYTGAAPSIGDFLTTSAVAGSAQRQITMRPEICAVCTAAGAGGTVETLLLTGRAFITRTDTQFLYGLTAASDSDFVSTIATLPGGAVLTYSAPSSGAEDTIAPWAALGTFNANLMLHNTTPTRTPSALISAVNTGTNTITLTANVPGDWVTTDAITCRSQTNTQLFQSASYYYDFDFSGMTNLPNFPVGIVFYASLEDSGGAGAIVSYHPFESYAGSKNFQAWTQVVTQRFLGVQILPNIDNTFQFAWDATGVSTTTIFLSHIGWIEATP